MSNKLFLAAFAGISAAFVYTPIAFAGAIQVPCAHPKYDPPKPVSYEHHQVKLPCADPPKVSYHEQKEHHEVKPISYDPPKVSYHEHKEHKEHHEAKPISYDPSKVSYHEQKEHHESKPSSDKVTGSWSQPPCNLGSYKAKS
jgi:hypothetical protein